MIDLPFDISYSIDSETLREIPNHPDQFRQAIEYLKAELQRNDLSPLQCIRYYGQIGVLARQSGDLVTAQDALYDAIKLCKQRGNRRAYFVNRLRLAHVYQWMRDFETSNALYEQLLLQPEPGYEDFLYQHAGKNAYDQGQYANAYAYFLRAYQIRKQKSDPHLLESSETALQAVVQKL